MKMKVEEVPYEAKISLVAERDELCTSLIGYFDIDFLETKQDKSNQMQTPVQFSTGPFTKDTHWHQTIFLLQHPVQLKKV